MTTDAGAPSAETWSVIDDRPMPQVERDRLASRFRSSGYVRLDGLLRDEVLERLRAEVRSLEAFAQSRSFTMAGPNTPRIMSVVGGSQVTAHGGFLATLGSNPQVRSLVSEIAGAEALPCQHPDEFTVCNFLLGTGSTHGWHLDDPAFALVIVLEAPEERCGGWLQYIPDWSGICRSIGVEPDGDTRLGVAAARRRGRVQTEYHPPGSVYLLRADQCLHRVTPLTEPGRRVVVNVAFEITTQPSYGHTASVLYGSGTGGSRRGRPEDVPRITSPAVFGGRLG